MADLDDFFAKKDKKKSKVKKFSTADELVKNLEDTSKLKPKPAAVVVNTNVSGDEVKPKETEPAPEEEWKEFEEEQRKDYTGLKIGQLTLDDDEELSQTEGDDEDGDSETNINSDTGSRSGGGPWKKVIPAEEVTQIPMEMEKPSVKTYVSPALRQSQATAAGVRLRARNRAAPDITNSDYFPTLGAARPEEQRKKKNEPAFEEVRHGGRMQRVQESTNAPTSVVNRFQTLDEDDS